MNFIFNKSCIFITTILVCNISNAQGIVFKCLDNQGNISYINEEFIKQPPYKSMKCNKQDLGDLMMIKNQDDGNKTPPKSNNESTSTGNLNLTKDMSISSNEQKKKNDSRKEILGKELEAEKTALQKVLTMLENVPTTDTEQVNKLMNLKKNHIQNIDLLSKEFTNH